MLHKIHPKVSIIIVTWNVESYIKRCLNSVFKALKGIYGEVIIVDNGSTDDTLKMIKNYPSIKLIKNNKNLGFAKANNIGIKSSISEYIILLNPDTEVAVDSLKFAVVYLSINSKVGILGAKLIDQFGNVQIPCTTTFCSIWDEFCIQMGLTKIFPKSKLFAHYIMAYWDHNSVREVDVVSGAFMAIRCNIIKECGMLDEKLSLYCEEEDFCYRVKNAGWKIVYHPNIRILHYGRRSTKQLKFFVPLIKRYNSHDYLSRKYNNTIKYLLIRGLRIVGIIIRLIFVLLYWGIFRINFTEVRKYLKVYMGGLKIQFSKFPKVS